MVVCHQHLILQIARSFILAISTARFVVCVCVCVRAYMCVGMHVYVCMHACVCVYIHAILVENWIAGLDRTCKILTKMQF